MVRGREGECPRDKNFTLEGWETVCEGDRRVGKGGERERKENGWKGKEGSDKEGTQILLR